MRRRRERLDQEGEWSRNRAGAERALTEPDTRAGPLQLGHDKAPGTKI